MIIIHIILSISILYLLIYHKDVRTVNSYIQNGE
nr:MAG TPA: hypothetical protein [Caudoviricetes sp.]DAV35684.1 MAG TPA: hypothetical protein [Caudoviricetes sp.]